jgi:glutathione synthase/RimK-type ligase-like ATP-grasp enzyme
MPYHLLFTTYAQHPALLPDDELAACELGKRGVSVTPAVWDDATIAWKRADAVIVRSSWDYFRKRAAFYHWLERLEREQVRIWNTVPLMRWNADKTYLQALERAGVPIVPTYWIYPDVVKPEHTALHKTLYAASETLATSMQALRTDAGASTKNIHRTAYILKPTFSAGSYHTMQFDLASASVQESPVSALLRTITLEHGSAAMLQPLIPEVLFDGELSLIFFHDGTSHAGTFSHAVRKTPAAGDFRIQEKYGGSTTPMTPAPHILEQAHRALSTALSLAPQGSDWLYARVDGVMIETTFVLMEIELIEPSLFFSCNASAAERFASVLMQRLAAHG